AALPLSHTHISLLSHTHTHTHISLLSLTHTSLSHTHTSLSSLSHTRTHTSLSLSLTHTHTHTSLCVLKNSRSSSLVARLARPGRYFSTQYPFLKLFLQLPLKMFLKMLNSSQPFVETMFKNAVL